MSRLDISCSKCGSTNTRPSYKRRENQLRWNCIRCGFVWLTSVLEEEKGGKNEG